MLIFCFNIYINHIKILFLVKFWVCFLLDFCNVKQKTYGFTQDKADEAVTFQRLSLTYADADLKWQLHQELKPGGESSTICMKQLNAVCKGH